jgi:hypothetical protein
LVFLPLLTTATFVIVNTPFYPNLITKILIYVTEHLLDAVQSQLCLSSSNAMENILQHCLQTAAEMHCDRSGRPRAHTSVLAVLSSWFLVLQSPIFAPSDSTIFEAVATQVIESPHPYLDSQDLSHSIKPSDESVISSIEYMEVTFDSRCRTESNCDYVTFWKDGARQGAQKYCAPSSHATTAFA